MNESCRSNTRTRGSRRALSGLVVAEIALALQAIVLAGTFANGTTTALVYCASYPQSVDALFAEAERRASPPPHLRLYVSGSAPLSPETFARFEQQQLVEIHRVRRPVRTLKHRLCDWLVANDLSFVDFVVVVAG